MPATEEGIDKELATKNCLIKHTALIDLEQWRATLPKNPLGQHRPSRAQAGQWI